MEHESDSDSYDDEVDEISVDKSSGDIYMSEVDTASEFRQFYSVMVEPVTRPSARLVSKAPECTNHHWFCFSAFLKILLW
jgi:hypothetical protein